MTATDTINAYLDGAEMRNVPGTGPLRKYGVDTTIPASAYEAADTLREELEQRYGYWCEDCADSHLSREGQALWERMAPWI